MRSLDRNKGVLLDTAPFNWEVIGWSTIDGGPIRWSTEGPAGLNPTRSTASIMSDHLTWPDSRGRFVQPCDVDHIQLVRGYDPISVPINFAGPYFAGTATLSVNGHGIMPYPLGGGIPPNYGHLTQRVTQSEVNPWAKEAISVMTSQFPREIDIFNFIRELQDLPKLLGAIKDIKDLAQSLGNTGDRSLSDVASSLHLTNQMGLQPLLADIPKFLKMMDAINKRLDWFRNNKGKWTKIGHRSSLLKLPIDLNFTYGIPSGDAWVRVLGVQRQVKFACSAYVKQEFSWLDDLQGLIRGIAGVGGLNKPLSVIWEMIPFSWAVDYFLPIGDFLDTFSFGDDAEWAFKDVTWSSKSWYRYYIFIETYGQSSYLCSFDLSRYQRYMGFPPVSFWDFNFPDIRQLSLLAAVGATR